GVQHPVVGLAAVNELHDVRMREPGAQPPLAPEARALVLDVRRRVVEQQAKDLDRHILAGRELARFVNPAEPSGAELGEDLVSPLEDRADREGWFARARHSRRSPELAPVRRVMASAPAKAWHGRSASS